MAQPTGRAEQGTHPLRTRRHHRGYERMCRAALFLRRKAGALRIIPPCTAGGGGSMHLTGQYQRWSCWSGDRIENPPRTRESAVTVDITWIISLWRHVTPTAPAATARSQSDSSLSSGRPDRCRGSQDIHSPPKVGAAAISPFMASRRRCPFLGARCPCSSPSLSVVRPIGVA